MASHARRAARTRTIKTATPPETHNTPAHWKEVAEPYKGADDRQSALQLTITAIAFFGLWIAMYFSLSVSYFLTLALAFPTAAFLVRLFMIQHDCGHGSYFTSKKMRDTVGFCLGVLTLTPYHYWLKTHAYHHSHAGDLDFRGFGDIETWTLKEYMSRSRFRRFFYRIYRNPVILLSVGPAFHFFIKHRFPWDIPRSWRQAWLGVWWTNLALALIVLAMTYTIGLGTFLMIQVPVTLISCSIGVWLFYVQHQFEETYWHHHEDWNYFDAALHGSSHLVLPRPLQWMTANIGLHHVHHLNSQIPFYKLEQCMDSCEDLQKATKITLAEGWRLFRLTLWDEENNRMITFRDLKKIRQQMATA